MRQSRRNQVRTSPSSSPLLRRRLTHRFSGEDLPQSFESSLSTQDLEEVEWIAWPCSQWCKTKGLCSYHSGGTHEEYVQARLEGYARSNPRKLEKILDELDKRRLAHKLYQSSFSADVGSGVRPLDFSLDVWREKIRALSRSRLSTTDVLDEAAVDDEDDVLPPVLSTSSLPTPIHKNWSPLECLPLEILGKNGRPHESTPGTNHDQISSSLMSPLTKQPIHMHDREWTLHHALWSPRG